MNVNEDEKRNKTVHRVAYPVTLHNYTFRSSISLGDRWLESGDDCLVEDGKKRY